MAADQYRRSALHVGLVIAVAAVGINACTSDDPSSATTESTSPASSLGSARESVSASPAAPVAIVGAYESVEFYPACGSETLDHLGVTWYQLLHSGNQAMYPALQERFDEAMRIERDESPVRSIAGFVRVPAPSPGDDIGTLVVWADGVSRWVSNNGQLDVWMADEKIVNPWPC